MSEVLSPEEERGERERDEAEEAGRAEDGEAVDRRACGARARRRRRSRPSTWASSPVFGSDPVEAADERGRPLGRRAAASICRWPERIAATKKTANVAMIETAVDEVTTPTRNAKAISVAIVKKMIAPAEEEARVDDARLPPDDEPHRADEVDDVQRRRGGARPRSARGGAATRPTGRER